MSKHMGIGCTRRRIEHGLGVHCIKTLFPLRCAHIAVAVPLRLTALKANTVNHAITKEPVAGLSIFRVRTIAHVQTRQTLRN